MKFCFDKPACQNIRRALRKEWVLTNGLGSYASSSILGCNTRKYHGLFNVNLANPAGRFVLLSTMEESVFAGGKEFFFSCRKHPDVYYPKGHEYLEHFDVSDWPTFSYKIGPLDIVREMAMIYKQDITIFKYTVRCDIEHPPFTLRVKPLLAYRNMHDLTCENDTINKHIEEFPHGFAIQPYAHLPKMYMVAQSDEPSTFTQKSDWCRTVQYFVEQERGFPYEEDLYSAGMFEIPLEAGKAVYLAVSMKTIKEPLSELWEAEALRRINLSTECVTLLKHLRRRNANFLTRSPQGDKEIVAGYPWFQAWGRDTLIALPGITFAANRVSSGKDILQRIAKTIQHGLVPNMFSADGNNSFNTIDAALWFVWAVQMLEEYAPQEDEFIRTVCYPAIKKIIEGYYNHVDYVLPDVYVNEDGLLHAGNNQTQLTWMDANAYGKPVTPRHGYAVEINALWYNALAYLNKLSKKYGEPSYCPDEQIRGIRKAFLKMFWTDKNGGYLGDVYNENGLDTAIRPNQIFAVSLPFAVLGDEEQPCVVECVRNNLLTPYGLRTLSPRDEKYHGIYEGSPDQRDEAYHQGTVWTWLLGAYGDALLRTAWDTEGAVSALLNNLTPLFTTHLADAGLGTISEIFAGNPPHLPDGCVAQAWSVSESYRLLLNLQKAAPAVFEDWEKLIVTTC